MSPECALPSTRVLHIDPDPLAIHQLKLHLPSHIALRSFGTPEKARSASPHFRPAIVLASVNQLGTSGPALCRKLRRTDSLAEDCILVVYGPKSDDSLADVDLMLKIRFELDHVLVDAEIADLVALVNKVSASQSASAAKHGFFGRILSKKKAPAPQPPSLQPPSPQPPSPRTVTVEDRPSRPSQVLSARLPGTQAPPSWGELLTEPVKFATIQQVLTKPISI
jgi:hypothetical protein